jgi:16S rRNA (guanine966-N2)-methyltransferase
MALRVVAGKVGGRKLVAPKGPARPTTDRLKEAMFASLGAHRLTGVVVLDLYAGSGALAIEALSRGAGRAVLVDHDFAAEVAISANLRALGLADDARFQRSTVANFLSRPISEAPFDLVLLDPPYETPGPEIEAVLDRLATGAVVAPGATVMIERPRGGEPIALPSSWQIERERPYGDTLLIVATF